MAAAAAGVVQASLLQKGLFPLCRAALLGFEHKAVMAIEIDKAGAGRAVGVVEPYGVLEHVSVAIDLAAGGIRVRQAERVAQLDQEQLVVGPLRRRRVLPARNECGDRRFSVG